MKAEWCRHTLDFSFTAITSRERLTRKDTYYIKVWHPEAPEVFGLGECALFRGLSCDDTPYYEKVLTGVCRDIDRYVSDRSPLDPFPSIKMGLETALGDLRNGGRRIPFAPIAAPIRINGLVWMGDEATMSRRIDEKLAAGFTCIKIKIGALDLDRELSLVEELRRRAPQVEIRLDANGAFDLKGALSLMDRLAPLGIHSVEQPIRAGQYAEMAELCRVSPVPVALDEELIGFHSAGRCAGLLDRVTPQWIVLKPSLCGGFSGADRWIALAEERGIGWWATSALESNVGLNAIASWLSARPALPMAQGLGTGQLYTNNIPSPLRLDGEWLSSDPTGSWNLEGLF